MRRDAERLRDMLQAIGKIERFATGCEALKKDELLQTWVVHHIEIIGEAARGVSEELRKTHRTVPWRELGLLRNELVHEYFAIDVDEVWKFVERDLPELKRNLTTILDQLGKSS